MANKRIIDLVATGSVATADLFEIDTGAASLKATGAQVATMVKSVAPAISQNAGVAFGVQQNNVSGKTLIVVVSLNIAWDSVSPGIYRIDVLTNASNPSAMGTFSTDFTGIIGTSPVINTVITVPVAPGGWYKIVNTSDPGGGNTIASVWEAAL